MRLLGVLLERLCATCAFCRQLVALRRTRLDHRLQLLVHVILLKSLGAQLGLDTFHTLLHRLNLVPNLRKLLLSRLSQFHQRVFNLH